LALHARGSLARSLDEEQAGILRSQWGEPRSYPFAEPAEVDAGSDAGEFVLA
jgi:hypothetical protein